MPKVSEKFGGAYLKAEHLNGQPRIITIHGYDTEMIYGKEEYVVYFAGEKRGGLLRRCRRCLIAASLQARIDIRRALLSSYT